MKKLLFVIMCVFALMIGAYPLIYAFVDHQHTFLGSKSPELLHHIIWRAAFFAHIIFGGLALFIGWRQFGESFRNKYIRMHRSIGKIYVVSVLISSVSAIYMGVYANGEWFQQRVLSALALSGSSQQLWELYLYEKRNDPAQAVHDLQLCLYFCRCNA